MAEGYKIHLLPRSHPNSTIWTEINNLHKIFRLQCLQISPESFSSTYAREVEFTDAQWEARLQNPIAFPLVAVGASHSGKADEISVRKDVHDADDVLNGVWAGTTVLLGPLETSPDATKDAQNKPNDERCGGNRNESDISKRAKFEIAGMFVMPEARRLGLGKKLVGAAVDQAMILGREKDIKEIIIKLLVLPGNIKALGLYTKMGFYEVGHEKYGPEDGNAVIMELRCPL